MGDRTTNLRIAQETGWTVEPFDGSADGVITYNERLDKTRPPEDDGIRFAVPDYMNDLNVAHEFEDIAQDAYWKTLGEAVGFDFDYPHRNSIQSLKNLICATARQRAEAFAKSLKAMNE